MGGSDSDSRTHVLSPVDSVVMKVYIVWDPLYEHVISAHASKTGAQSRRDELREDHRCLWKETLQ